MDIRRLCKGLGLADEVEREILACEQAIHYEEIEEPMERLFSPDTWEQGIRETEGVLGEDPRGMKMLAVCLRCLQKTYRLYEEKGICEKVFWDTMGFIPRFLEAHRAQHGVYAFTWAWWLPRQISLHEFRIGEFEYEFARDGKKPVIWIHIPADARLAQGEIAGIYPFAQTYFPEYGDAPIRCASWMLVPALGEILPEDSRILQFQSRFDVTEVEEDNPAFMDWIYSCRTEDYASLPERTSLQKGVKKRLLDGGRIGWATGTYVGARPACLEGKVGMYEKMGYRDLGISQSGWGGEQWHEMSCRLHGV